MYEFRDEGATPFDLAVAAERARIVATALATLSDRQKQILVWIYVEDLSCAEVGQRLNVSKVAIWKLHRRILNTLAEQLSALR